jgi:hypothetical protein
MSLKSEIQAMAGELAAAAQQELDEWAPNQDGYDEELGYGGACDAISRRLSDVIMNKVEGVDLSDGGWEGDDHAYLLCSRGGESVVVDIPPSLYERGGGYSWRKIEGVKLEGRDVVIESIDLGLEARSLTLSGEMG